MYIMTKRRRKGNKKRGTRKLFKFIKNRRQRIKQRGRKFRRTFRKRRKQLNLRFRSLRRGGGGGKKRRRRPSKKKKKKKYGPSPRPAPPVAAAAAAKKAQKTADKKKIIADKAVEKAAASKTTADQKQKLANDAKTKLQMKSSSSKKKPSLKKAISKVQAMQKVANTKKVKAATDAKKAEQAKKEAQIAKQKAATTAAKLLSAKAKAKAQTRKKGKMVASAAAAEARSRKNKTRKKQAVPVGGPASAAGAPSVAARKAAFRAKQAKKKGATSKPAAPAPKKTAAPKPAAPAPKKTAAPKPAAKSPKPQCNPFIIATTPCKTLKKQYHNASRKGCHPDKGGSDIDFQTLKENYDAQDKWCTKGGQGSRPKVLGKDQWNCSKKPGYPDTWDKAKKKCNPKKAATSAKERPRAQPAARAPRQPAPTASKPQQQTKSGEGGLGGSSLSAPVMKGATKLPVRDSDVFHKGDVIRIGARGASEVRSVIGHGSIILNSPLTGNYPEGTPVTIIEHAHAPPPTPAEKAQKEATEKAHKEAVEKARKEAAEKARKEAEDKARQEAAKKKKQGEKCGDNADCASNVCSITLRTCSTEEAERALQKKEENQITTLTKQLKQRATPKSGAAAKIELSPAAKKEVQEKFASPPDSKGNRIVILKITGEQIGPSGSEGTVVRVNSGLSAPNSVAATGTAVKEGMDK